MTNPARMRSAQMVGGFITFFVENQDFGIVQRIFVVRFHTELSNLWTIQDYHGHVHHLEYIMDLRDPKITRGWSRLAQFYSFASYTPIVFKYMGNSEFHIQFGKSPSLHLYRDHVEALPGLTPLTSSALIHFSL